VIRRPDRQPPARLPDPRYAVPRGKRSPYRLPPDRHRQTLTQYDLLAYREDRREAVTGKGLDPTLRLLFDWSPTVQLPADLVTAIRQGQATLGRRSPADGTVAVDAAAARALVASARSRPDLGRKLRRALKKRLPRTVPPGFDEPAAPRWEAVRSEPPT
jgi:hypothetical protein